MNAVQRIELAIRRTASQMPDGAEKIMLRLLADELMDVSHDDNSCDARSLDVYRRDRFEK